MGLQKKTLTAVGRLVKEKGFDLLIPAFAQVASSFPEWQLIIWGEGPERNSLEQLVQALGMQQRIYLPGVSSQPGSWKAGSDTFVVSSRFEGWGNVVLEAMASGLPVVSFDCDWGPRDMIENNINGILVPAEDVTQLSKALALVMKDERLRKRIGARAALSVQKYSLDRIFGNWNALVSTALKTL